MHLEIAVALLCILVVHGKNVTITEKMGIIHFMNHIKTINYDFDLHSYYTNVDTFSEYLNALSEMCPTLPSETQCQTNVVNYESDLAEMNKNIKTVQIHHRQRKKRFWQSAAFAAGRLISTSVTRTLAVGIVSGLTATYMITSDEEKMNNYRYDRYHGLMEENLKKMREQIENEIAEREENRKLNLIMLKYQELEESMNLLASKHFRETGHLLQLFSKNIKSHLLDILGVEIFSQQIVEIAKALPDSFILPTLNPLELIDLSEISIEKNVTHLRVSIDLPIVENRTILLQEMIPIPFIQDNSTKILKINSFLFLIDGNHTGILSLEALGECKKTEKMILCDSLVEKTLGKPDSCQFSLIANTTMYECTERIIEDRNYFMIISPRAVYCHITNPLNLQVSCHENNFMYELKQSGVLHYDENCNVFDISSTRLDNSTEFITVEIDFAFKKPNFSIYDTVLRDWSYNFTEIDRRNTNLLHTLERINTLIDEAHDLKNGGTDKSYWRGFCDFVGGVYDSVANLFSFTPLVKMVVQMIFLYVVLPLVGCCVLVKCTNSVFQYIFCKQKRK